MHLFKCIFNLFRKLLKALTSLQACGSVDPFGRQPDQQWRPLGGSAAGRLQSGASREEAAHRIAFGDPLSEAFRSSEGSQPPENKQPVASEDVVKVGVSIRCVPSQAPNQVP